MSGPQMAQNGQIHDFHGKKGQKVKEINVNMPCHHKCDITTCIYIPLDRLNNLPASGVEGSPIEGDQMDQNHQIGTLPQYQGFCDGEDERFWIPTQILFQKCLKGSTMSTLMVRG